MYVWKKQVPPTDRPFWEERLHCHEDSSLVITETCGKKRLKLEIYFEIKNHLLSRWSCLVGYAGAAQDADCH
jgi:hypothetical protein